MQESKVRVIRGEEGDEKIGGGGSFSGRGLCCHEGIVFEERQVEASEGRYVGGTHKMIQQMTV